MIIVIFCGRLQCVKGLILPVFVPLEFLTSPALRMPAQSLFAPITLHFQVLGQSVYTLSTSLSRVTL